MNLRRECDAMQVRVCESAQCIKKAGEKLRQYPRLIVKSRKICTRSNSEQKQSATSTNLMMSSQPHQTTQSRAQMLEKRPLVVINAHPSCHTSFLGLILQLMVGLLIFAAVLLENQAVCAMSKRFLKGFIMGAMFAHHHKP